MGIVFHFADSCKGTSLNDTMLTEPKLQTGVLEVLLRFRQKLVALVPEIKGEGHFRNRVFFEIANKKITVSSEFS